MTTALVLMGASGDDLRLWPYLKATDSGCWEWQRSRNRRGYGNIGWRGKHTLAHRAAFELTTGPIPSGAMVLHTCDNPPCCNPDHLVLGTHLDNMAHMVARGRIDRRGSKHPRTSLTDEDVMVMRRRYAARNVTLQELADEYGLSMSSVGRLISGRTWGHLPLVEAPRETRPGFCGCGCGQRTPVAKQTTTTLGHVRGEPIRFIRGHGTRGRSISR